ncbi:putative inorganic phosphate transporter 1-7 [Quercus suber]|uniref:Inorganic phosphate transporter 1-7 n=1 Tax=Quercus suber TaxID=58331 RepID=A0AAW0L1T7_QUESU
MHLVCSQGSFFVAMDFTAWDNNTWFLLDIAFYSQNLFQKDIFSAIGWIPPAKTMNAIEEVYRIARAQTLIALCSTVPGYWFTVAFIDKIGRFAIQLMVSSS